MGYLCNRFLYTQADILVEVVFIGLLLARLCKGYRLEDRLQRERVVGQMEPLTEAEILQFGIPRIAVPSDKEDVAGMDAPSPPPTFPPIPPEYATVRG